MSRKALSEKTRDIKVRIPLDLYEMILARGDVSTVVRQALADFLTKCATNIPISPPVVDAPPKCATLQPDYTPDNTYLRCPHTQIEVRSPVTVKGKNTNLYDIRRLFKPFSFIELKKRLEAGEPLHKILAEQPK